MFAKTILLSFHLTSDEKRNVYRFSVGNVNANIIPDWEIDTCWNLRFYLQLLTCQGKLTEYSEREKKKDIEIVKMKMVGGDLPKSQQLCSHIKC